MDVRENSALLNALYMFVTRFNKNPMHVNMLHIDWIDIMAKFLDFLL